MLHSSQNIQDSLYCVLWGEPRDCAQSSQLIPSWKRPITMAGASKRTNADEQSAAPRFPTGLLALALVVTAAATDN
jgi:hypothetical protein